MTEYPDNIKNIIVQLGISENVKHFMLSNGQELIGEVVVSDDNEITIANPLKIDKTQSYIDDSQIIIDVFEPWNTYSDVPITTISKKWLVSETKINKDVMIDYVIRISELYFPEKIDLTTILFNDVPPKKADKIDTLTSKSNITYFNDYLIRRIAGLF